MTVGILAFLLCSVLACGPIIALIKKSMLGFTKKEWAILLSLDVITFTSVYLVWGRGNTNPQVVQLAIISQIVTVIAYWNIGTAERNRSRLLRK